MDKQASFGVVGMGVMGSNMALNIEDKGFTVALLTRNFERAKEVASDNPGKKLIPTKDAKSFVATLERPRRILILVPAGKPVDSVIASLIPLLDKDDVIIDGGNEFYTETERRLAELQPKGIHFIGMGVSGGAEGARLGPSMMPGGPRPAYDRIEEVVTKIAAQVDDGPCVTYIGPGGAGHYVKMVHNGIEYGDMQLIAETYDLLRRKGGLSNSELADVFSEWNSAELDSFLIEITAQIFKQKDDLGNGDLIDAILDTAKMKGTGSWTVAEGAKLPAAIPTVASAVDARIISSQRELRSKASELLSGPTVSKSDKKQLIADARAALYAAKIVSYAQGLNLLTQASTQRNWNLNLGEIARIWKGGCIIRARLLGDIQSAMSGSAPDNLMFDSDFAQALRQRQDGWRRTVSAAVLDGIPVAGLSGSLAYYDTMRTKRLPANLVQAQRDFFGSHTYQRLDREGSFHTEWDS